MISTKIICSLICAVVLAAGPCTSQQKPPEKLPEKSKDNYPLVLEASPARQQAAEDAWNSLLSENRLAFTQPEFEPILYTPRALPAALANQINIKPQEKKADEILDEAQAKEYLRRFIERYHAVLSGDQRVSSLSLKDISLINFSSDSSMFRATYQQMNYPFPLANGFGELRITISKTGAILQLSSTIIPAAEFPARPKIDVAESKKRFVGREFTYSNFAGQPLTYKVAQEAEISLKDLVIYPRVTDQKMTLHLVYPFEIGRGTTWTVFVDAVTGEEIETKQNFQS